MSDDQNKNLNTMSLANQDEVPMSVESISNLSQSPANNNAKQDTASSGFNQNTIVNSSSFSSTQNNTSTNTISSLGPTPLNGTGSNFSNTGTNGTATDYKNIIEEQAKAITTPESQKINLTNSSGKGNFFTDNKKVLIITGVVSLAVVLLGVGGFALYTTFSTTSQPVNEAVTEQPAVVAMSKEEYLNEISSAEITYIDIKSTIVESFSRFSDPTITELFYNAIDKNSSVADRLSQITPPEEYKETHASLVSYFTSLTYTLEVIGTNIANKDAAATNDLVPILNSSLTGIEEEFKKIQGN